MARTGERGVTPARGKDVEFGIKTRMDYFRAVQELWKMETAKQGAQGVTLQISNRKNDKESGNAGWFDAFFNPDGNRGSEFEGKFPTVRIYAPTIQEWDKGFRGDLVATSRTLRHELIHFQQWRRAQVGRDERPTQDVGFMERHHGPDFRAILDQFGGTQDPIAPGTPDRPKPSRPHVPGRPPAQPRRGNPPRFGPPSLPIDQDLKRSFGV